MKKKLFSFPPPPPDQPTTSVHTKPTNPTSVPAFFFAAQRKKQNKKLQSPPNQLFFSSFLFFSVHTPNTVLSSSSFCFPFFLRFSYCSSSDVGVKGRVAEILFLRDPPTQNFKKNAPPFFFLYLARARTLFQVSTVPPTKPTFFNVSLLFCSPTALAPVEWGGARSLVLVGGRGMRFRKKRLP